MVMISCISLLEAPKSLAIKPRDGRTASIERAVIAIKEAMRKTNSTLLIRKDFNIECGKERLDCTSYHYQTSLIYQTKFNLIRLMEYTGVQIEI
jgi:hypothetical protein